MLAVLTGLGAAKKEFYLLVPAPAYFLAIIFTRIVSLITDGTDSGTIRALVLAVVLFVITEVAAQLIKRAGKSAI
jgi:hypothetical protein